MSRKENNETLVQRNPKDGFYLGQKNGSNLEKILNEFHPGRLISSLIAALVTSIMAVPFCIAFGLLLFSADLPAYLATAINYMLFGQMVVVVVSALFSSFRGVVSGLQEAPLAIFILVSTAIMQYIPESQPEQRFFTLVVAIALSTVLTGLTAWLLGKFKLADFVRYIPYPVIGGFLAGSGLLLVLGSISLMAFVPASIYEYEWLLRPELYLHWVPGILFALTLTVLLRRYTHFLVLPVTMLASIGLFYAILWMSGTPISFAFENGFLLDVFSSLDSGAWQPIGFEELSKIDWTIIYQQAGSIFAIILVSIIALLLNITALEISTNENIDINREMRVAGFANVLSGLGGGAIGFHAISDTQLSYNINARNRMVGVIQGILCLFVMLFGGSLFSFFPTTVLGGFLALVGIDLLMIWLFDACKRLPRNEYIMIIVIMLVINLMGILEGVGIGLLLTVIQFIIRYSKVSVVRHEFSGESYRSNVVRPRLYQQLLRQKGQWLCILELQGFIFFGSVEGFYCCLRSRFEQMEFASTRFIVLDFKYVTGMDASAIFSFEKLINFSMNQGLDILLTGMKDELRKQIGHLIDEYHLNENLFDDLDHGVEWCENKMIATFESVGFGAKPETLIKQLDAELSVHGGFDLLCRYMEMVAVEKGTCIVSQGEKTDGIFFVESGLISIWLESSGVPAVRIRTMGPGAVIGELGFYLGIRSTASVYSEDDAVVYRLSRSGYEQLEKEYVEVAGIFHKFIAGMLSERLVLTEDVLQSFSR